MFAMTRRLASDRGIALIATLLVMILVSALLVGFTASVMSDQRFRGIDRDRSMSFYAAQAGLEKLTADFGNYFQTNFAPTKAQVTALTTTSPTISGISFTATGAPSVPATWTTVGNNGYTISFNADASGNPKVGSSAPVSSGPYQGLIAELTPYQLDVTSKTFAGTEVHLLRSFETVAIPVFQFGMFSDTDLSFFPGSNFNFGGRVHTNGNLFLASGATLTLADKVTAVKDVIRQDLSNAVSINTATTHNATVSMIDAPGAYRNLAATEGSLTGFVGSAKNNSWTNISLSTYNGYIRNGLTGAHALNLPIITAGGSNADLARRPASATEDTTNPTLFGERYFSKVSLRILLSDTAADLTNLPTVTATAPVSLDGNWNTTPPNNGTAYGPVNATHPPIATSGGPKSVTTNANTAANAATINVASIPAGWGPPTLTLNATAVTCTGRTPTSFTGCTGTPASAKPATITATINSVALSTTTTANTAANAATIQVTSTSNFGQGFFWMNASSGSTAYTAVTCTGNTSGPASFTGCNGTPASTNPATLTTNYLTPAGTGVIGGFVKIEMQDTSYVWHDVTMEILNLGIAGPNLAGTGCGDPTPNAIIRLQRLRDNGTGSACSYASSLNSNDYWPNVLFDTREALQRDTAPASGLPILGGAMYYVALDVANLSKWFQGTIGATGSTALTLNGYSVYFSDRRNNRTAANLETGDFGFEDIINTADPNGAPNGTLDAGEDVNGSGLLDTYGNVPSYNGTANSVAPGSTAPLTTAATILTQLPGSQAMVNRPILFRRALKLINGSLGNIVAPGLAIVAENPVYIQGNWNANAAGFGSPHVATSVAADAVTLLSNEWTDVNSFANPYDPASRARTTNPYYRVAIIAGKNISFLSPAWMTTTSDFGTDGGAHNFMRFLESGGTVNYEGSLVTFYYSRQAIGIYKCCNTVYSAPTRAYQFDTDFLTPALLPPLTPVFRDLDDLGFTQEIRPGK
jgi:Tfp pilus assembly protein PilX